MNWGIVLAVVRTGAALAVMASAPALAGSDIELDKAIEGQKERALEVGAWVLDSQQRALHGHGSLISVFVGSATSGASVVDAAVAVDGQTEVQHHFDDAASRALAADAAYRLAEIAAPAGDHQVSVRLLVRYPGGNPDSAPTELKSISTVSLTEQDVAVTAHPTASSWVTAPSLELSLRRSVDGGDEAPSILAAVQQRLAGQKWSDDPTYVHGAPDDPQIRYIRYLDRTRDYLQAAVRLKQMQAQQAGKALPGTYFQLLADVLSDYGTGALARTALDQATATGMDDEAATDLRLKIAELLFQRGRFDDATRMLGAMPPRREQTRLGRWQDLKSRILIATGEIGGAGDVLKSADNVADFESYVRYYNLGVSLLRDGLVGQGATVLDRIGTIQGTTRDMQSLSALANLTLGAHFLHAGQGATAIPILERIPLTGQYSNRALLDLGWASLAPAGNQQNRVELGDERTIGLPPESVGAQRKLAGDDNVYQRYHLAAFQRAKLDADPNARLKRALAIWSVLIDRDPEDEAVQESFVAVAYALAQLGAYEESRAYSERAVASIRRTLGSISEAEAYVAGDSWVGEIVEEGPGAQFDRTLSRLPRASIASHLVHSLSSREFQHALASYRDLDVLERAAAGWGEQLDAADNERVIQLRHNLHDLKKLAVISMRQQLLSDLKSRQEWAAQRLQALHYEVARIYDGFAINSAK